MNGFVTIKWISNANIDMNHQSYTPFTQCKITSISIITNIDHSCYQSLRCWFGNGLQTLLKFFKLFYGTVNEVLFHHANKFLSINCGFPVHLCLNSTDIWYNKNSIFVVENWVKHLFRQISSQRKGGLLQPLWSSSKSTPVSWFSNCFVQIKGVNV